MKYFHELGLLFSIVLYDNNIINIIYQYYLVGINPFVFNTKLNKNIKYNIITHNLKKIVKKKIRNIRFLYIISADLHNLVIDRIITVKIYFKYTPTERSINTN